MKLSHEEVRQIRELSKWKKAEIERINSIASFEALAEKFGVTKDTVFRAASGKSYGHVRDVAPI